MSITYYSEIDAYPKFIEELKKINVLYTKYVECKQRKAFFKRFITLNPLPGNIIRKIDDIYSKRDRTYTKTPYYGTRNSLFIEFFNFLKFFNKDIDEDDFYQNKNLYDYSKEILEKLNEKLKKKCQLPNNGNVNVNGTRNGNGNGNRRENNLGPSNNGNVNVNRTRNGNGNGNRRENNLGPSNNGSMVTSRINRKNGRSANNRTRNMIRSRVISRRNANNPYRINGLNLRKRRNESTRRVINL